MATHQESAKGIELLLLINEGGMGGLEHHCFAISSGLKDRGVDREKETTRYYVLRDREAPP